MTQGTVINSLYYEEEKFLATLKNDYEGKNFNFFVKNILLNLDLKLIEKSSKLQNKAVGIKEEQEKKAKDKAEKQAEKQAEKKIKNSKEKTIQKTRVNKKNTAKTDTNVKIKTAELM